MNETEDDLSYRDLIKSLGKFGLKCGHLNVNGLYHKLDEVKILLDETKFDILAITETHLRDAVTDSEVAIEGYLSFRKDRTGKKKWGGTLIYYKEHLDVHELLPVSNMDKLEAIWLEVIIKSQKLLIATIYRPPDQKDFLLQLAPVLDKFHSRSNILILGDFNIDMSSSSNSPLRFDFARLMSKSNLYNIIKSPTRITDCSSTIIDLAITSDPSKVKVSGSYEAGISDHNLIYVTINILTRNPPPRIIEVKSYSDVNKNDLKFDLDATPWDLISLFEDVDDALSVWEELFRSVLKDHVKTRKVKVRTNNNKWMNGEIRKTLNNRYKLLNRAKVTPRGSPEWLKYKQARNRCTNIIRNAKASFWKNEFQKANSAKSFWTTVRKFEGKSKKFNIGPLLRNDTIVLDNAEKANAMNNFFSNVGKNLAKEISPNLLTDKNSHIFRVTPTLSDFETSIDTFSKAFKASVKPGKAGGHDNITSRDLNLCSGSIIPNLHMIFKKSIESGKFPTSWKRAKVSCIYKKGSKKDCSNYRPISLLTITSKVVERSIYLQLKDHLDIFNLHSPHQWGFRENHSTEDLLLHMTEKWQKALDEGKYVAVLFVDLKKAFDSISHNVLHKKLAAHGLSGNALLYLQDYLTHRNQFTIVNGSSSSDAKVEYGVPQGSILGPTCFTMNIADMPTMIDSDSEMFADDQTAFEIDHSLDSALTRLQNSIHQLQSYTSSNSLTIHPEKCEIIIISKSPFIGPLPDISINGKTIKFVESAKCLGLTIDSRLTWRNHIKKTCQAFSSKIKKLFRMKSFSTKTLQTVYLQGILPSVLYGIKVWGSCSTNLIQDLEMLHLRSARFVKRISKRVSDSDVLTIAKWKDILHYYKRSVAVKAYQIYHKTAPIQLHSLLKPKTGRTTRNVQGVELPSFRYSKYKSSFAYRSAIIWNNLTNETRAKHSKDTFKASLLKSNTTDW